MKKLLIMLLCGMMLFGITACGSENESSSSDDNSSSKASESGTSSNGNKTSSKSLSCSGKFSMMSGVIFSRTHVAGGNDDEYGDPNDYFFDDEYGETSDGEYTFTFDSNGIAKFQGKEILDSKTSKEIDDEDLESFEAGKAYRNSKGLVVIEYTLDANDDLVKALNTNNKTKADLKERLEKNTKLVCE